MRRFLIVRALVLACVLALGLATVADATPQPPFFNFVTPPTVWYSFNWSTGTSAQTLFGGKAQWLGTNPSTGAGTYVRAQTRPITEGSAFTLREGFSCLTGPAPAQYFQPASCGVLLYDTISGRAESFG